MVHLKKQQISLIRYRILHIRPNKQEARMPPESFINPDMLLKLQFVGKPLKETRCSEVNR